MASVKSSDDDNLPSPFEELGGLHPTDKENEASHVHTSSAADFLYPACVSLLDSPMENVYGTVQSYAEDPVICRTGTDFMRFGTLQSSQNLRGGSRNQGFYDTGFLNPWGNVNCVPSESTSGGYAMNVNERVANRNWPQTAASSDASIFNSTIEVVPRDDIKVDASHPGNADGSFLTLGLGADAECRAEARFSSREFPGTIAPQNNNLYVLPTSTNYSNPSQKSTQDFLGFQSSPGAIPRPMFNSGGWTSHCNDKESGTVNRDTFGLVQSPYPFHSPSASQHYPLFGNLGFVSNSPGINPTMAVPAGYQGSPVPYSLPSNSFNTNYPLPGFGRHYDLASESANSIWTTLPPPIYQAQNDDKKDRDVPFSIVSHRTTQSGSSVAHDYLGLLTPPTEGFSSHALESIPPSLGPTPTHKLNPAQGFRNICSSDKFGLQIAKNHAITPATAGPLPSSTFGIQPDNSAQSNQEIQLRRQAGVLAKSNLIHDQAYKPLDTDRFFVGPTSGSGPPDIILPPPDSWRPPSTGPGLSSLQVHKAPQTSYVTRKSSLKRTAAEPPKVPSWGRRRKFVHVPPQSTNHGKQGVAATPPPPATSYVSHIKCPGFDESPKLVGWKCLLCKKDLSFSPDNPVHQPTIPPAVAVLPCGHTFHDQCLQLITPAEQAKDPPCIPCAIGEN